MTTDTISNELADLPLNARTRRVLTGAGITNLDALGDALLSDHPIRGLGPKGLEDIDRALDRADEVRESDKRREAAVGTIFREHGRLSELIMLTTDLAIGISNGEDVGIKDGHALKGPNMRKAVAPKLRESLRNTTEALRVLAPEMSDMVFEWEQGGDA